MKNLYFILCFLLATLYSNSLEAQTPPTFTSTPVTTVNGNEIYNTYRSFTNTYRMFVSYYGRGSACVDLIKSLSLPDEYNRKAD